ncbi:nucleotidyltransferase family protein [Shewanella gelidii]|uniref:Translation initiation factor eIF2B subunit gamma n=1 Tax=Shewanella gelidii TaxID=1642821 RepID=A0A917JJJ7_9GAMM|nr:NDP-sugar synthase [Shewanella gelidii]MCL1096410.1 NDP-sugar synthase [Shewanella gelidii]GGI67235.1 hypothetical protein GCM10009332_00380 [Shewanella gelidii]
MQAIIFANRTGSEVAPLNQFYTPALLPVANKAVIEYAIEDLARAGIQDIKIVADTHSQAIAAHLQKGCRWGVQLSYFPCQQQERTEDIIQRLTVHQALPTLLVRGDILRSPCIEQFIAYAKNMSHGSVDVLINHKPAGLVLLQPSQSKAVELTQAKSLNWPLQQQSDKSPVTQVIHGMNYHLDSLDDYLQANRDIASQKVAGMTPQGHALVSGSANRLFVGAQSKICSAHEQNANGAIGKCVQIHSSCRLQGQVVIGDLCNIGAETKIENSLVLPNTFIGEHLSIKNSIVCQNHIIQMDTQTACKVTDNTVIGESISQHTASSFFQSPTQEERTQAQQASQTHNLEQTHPTTKTLEVLHQSSFLERFIALCILVISLPCWPMLHIAAWLKQPHQMMIKNPFIDNRGQRFASWQWHLPPQVVARLPELWHVVSGRLKFFGRSAAAHQHQRIKPDSVLATNHHLPVGVFGPEQLLLSKAPIEQILLAEIEFMHQFSAMKGITLIWQSLRNATSLGSIDAAQESDIRSSILNINSQLNVSQPSTPKHAPIH